jgi:hypothetical protein
MADKKVEMEQVIAALIARIDKVEVEIKALTHRQARTDMAFSRDGAVGKAVKVITGQHIE